MLKRFRRRQRKLKRVKWANDLANDNDEIDSSISDAVIGEQSQPHNVETQEEEALSPTISPLKNNINDHSRHSLTNEGENYRLRHVTIRQQSSRAVDQPTNDLLLESESDLSPSASTFQPKHFSVNKNPARRDHVPRDRHARVTHS